MHIEHAIFAVVNSINIIKLSLKTNIKKKLCNFVLYNIFLRVDWHKKGTLNAGAPLK